MRYFLAILASLLLTCEVYAEETDYDKKLVECANEAGLNMDDLNNSIINKDGKAGCVLACTMKKIALMVDGKLVKDVIISTVENEKDNIPDYEKIKEDLLQCYDEVANDEDLQECDVAANFAYCMHSKGN